MDQLHASVIWIHFPKSGLSFCEHIQLAIAMIAAYNIIDTTSQYFIMSMQLLIIASYKLLENIGVPCYMYRATHGGMPRTPQNKYAEGASSTCLHVVVHNMHACIQTHQQSIAISGSDFCIQISSLRVYVVSS